MIAPLIADGGEMTVLRQLATYTWGTWSVTWPEGIDPPELPDERDFGFVSKLSEPTGRFARRFDRADVSIDVENEFSDVEFVLDEAAGRMAGDAFFERDITNAGLGRQVPLVDFSIGDVVPVLIWGKVIDLPVTSIERVSEVGNAVGWRVHVGGQLLGDSVGLDQGNREIYRQIAQERRERIGDVAAVDQKAEVAKGTADTAKTTADDALAAATDADGVIQGYITEGRGHVADALASAELASGHVSAAQTLVDEAEALVDEADGLNEDIKSTFQQMQLLRQQATKSVRVASGQAAQAIVHAGEAHRFVEQARSYNTQIAAHVEDAQSAVEEGREHADAAARSVSAASQSAGEAQTALTGATNLLADVDGEGTDFPTAITQVVTAHNDVLLKHQDVLNKHGEAITSATNAATSATNAANANTDAIIAMNAANRARDDAIVEASAAAGSAGAAAQSLSDAVDKVIEAQGILEDNQAIQTEINTKHGQAIKAAARAAGQASMAAMQANETARSAALAADSALDAIDAMDEALTAKEAAEDARDATLTNVAELTWLSHFRRTRVNFIDRNYHGAIFITSIFFDDGTEALFIDVNEERVRISKRSTWSGVVKWSALGTAQQFGMDSLTYDVGTDGQSAFTSRFDDIAWQRLVVEIYPEFPSAAERTKFRTQATQYKPLK